MANGPLVIDSTTPSCGDSRFGLLGFARWWTKIARVQAMIQNDTDKEWMQPLLDLRNALDVPDDRPLRDFRRMSGHIQLFNDRLVPGPYTQAARQKWLEDLLRAQLHVQIHWPGGNGKSRADHPARARRRYAVSGWSINMRSKIACPSSTSGIVGKPYPGGRLDDSMSFDAGGH